STVSFGLGEFADALRVLGSITGYRIGVAEPQNSPGYDPRGLAFRSPELYRENTLPYTSLVAFGRYTRYTNPSPEMPYPIAPFEQRFFKLAQGEAMLAWADQLYRNDDPSSIRRARELYKGVLFVHGEDPEIAPS